MYYKLRKLKKKG